MNRAKFQNYVQKFKSPAKYLITGSAAFIVDYLVLMGCYYVLLLDLSLATTMGYFVSFFLSFFLNKKWTFNGVGQDRNVHRQVTEYALLVIFNYLVTLGGINLLNNMGVAPWLGKVVLLVVIVVWNYFIYKKYIFVKK